MSQLSNFNQLCMGCMNVNPAGGVCPHCGFVDTQYIPSPQHLPLGTVLGGKYLTGRVLGEGGFGITYIGMDLNLDMKVAVKEYYPNGFVSRDATHSTVIPYMGEPSELFAKGKTKFIDEAKSLAKFRNLAGIVSVNDFFLENDTAYIIMEFVNGQTLKTYLTTHKLSPTQVFSMMLPVMQSLSYVHQAGMIHRDISPDNIMIAEDGSMKLLDFGAARDFTNSGNKSLSVLLKLGYAPAEQYSSKGLQGPWTDVYALCATMYKILTGITPDESIDRMQNDQLKPPSQLGVVIQPQQERALLKGMAIQKDQRFQSVPELMAALYPKSAEVTVPYAHVSKNPEQPTKPIKPVKPVKPEKSLQPQPSAQPVSQPAKKPAVGRENPPKKGKQGMMIGICAAGALVLAFAIATISSPTPAAEKNILPQENKVADTEERPTENESAPQTQGNDSLSWLENCSAELTKMILGQSLDSDESLAMYMAAQLTDGPFDLMGIISSTGYGSFSNGFSGYMDDSDLFKSIYQDKNYDINSLVLQVNDKEYREYAVMATPLAIPGAPKTFLLGAKALSSAPVETPTPKTETKLDFIEMYSQVSFPKDMTPNAQKKQLINYYNLQYSHISNLRDVYVVDTDPYPGTSNGQLFAYFTFTNEPTTFGYSSYIESTDTREVIGIFNAAVDELTQRFGNPVSYVGSELKNPQEFTDEHIAQKLFNEQDWSFRKQWDLGDHILLTVALFNKDQQNKLHVFYNITE